jgi:hypothetical protein
MLSMLSMLLLTPGFGAADSDYGPFRPTRRPKPFPRSACVEWRRIEAQQRNESSEWVLGSPDDRKRTGAHVRLLETAAGRVILEVWGSAGRRIVGPQVVSDGRYFGAHTGDLNADGRPDFVIETTYDGCGLAGWDRTLVFAISKDDDFEVSSISTMFRDDCDLVALNHDGRCNLIHVTVLWSRPNDEDDGKSHAYWVFTNLRSTMACGRFPRPTRTFRSGSGTRSSQTSARRSVFPIR